MDDLTAAKHELERIRTEFQQKYPQFDLMIVVVNRVVTDKLYDEQFQQDIAGLKQKYDAQYPTVHPAPGVTCTCILCCVLGSTDQRDDLR